MMEITFIDGKACYGVCYFSIPYPLQVSHLSFSLNVDLILPLLICSEKSSRSVSSSEASIRY